MIVIESINHIGITVSNLEESVKFYKELFDFDMIDKARQNARKNEYAHLKLDITVKDVLESRVLTDPIRMLEMCPASNG